MPTSQLFPRRTFGVLLHPTSLAGPEPIGTLGRQAEAWIDWLGQSGAGVWQILPLTYPGDEDSPYFSASAFAGSPWLIDLQNLAAAGLIDPAEPPPPSAAAAAGPGPIDYEAMRARKQPQLTAAADRFLADPGHSWRPDYEAFVADPANAWLTDACHFFALKAIDPSRPWWEWKTPLRRRHPDALAESAARLADEIEREQALQFFFERQWQVLRARAAAVGVTVLGDVPIYVAPDSADVWAHQEQFQLDRGGRQTTQAGVPPDYFSETGQLWRNPLYRWDVMAADGFSWWISRLRRALAQADVVRIDHFRGLSAYWSVPAVDETAANGHWVEGPGQPFVDAVRQAFPQLPIVAEDLGDLDADVVALRDDNDLLGMRVLQFGFDLDRRAHRRNSHHPDNVVEHSIVYTGTHDNPTLVGWWQDLGRRLRSRIRTDTAMPPRIRARKAARWLIGVAFRTEATVAIVPLQDLLGLDDSARMNVPGTEGGNWQWRMPAGCLSRPLATDVRELARSAGRLS